MIHYIRESVTRRSDADSVRSLHRLSQYEWFRQRKVNMNEHPRYKGRMMTKKQYNRCMKQIQGGLMRRKQKKSTDPDSM